MRSIAHLEQWAPKKSIPPDEAKCYFIIAQPVAPPFQKRCSTTMLHHGPLRKRVSHSGAALVRRVGTFCCLQLLVPRLGDQKVSNNLLASIGDPHELRFTLVTRSQQRAATSLGYRSLNCEHILRRDQVPRHVRHRDLRDRWFRVRHMMHFNPTDGLIKYHSSRTGS